MRARVPASSANLGPGFDVLALALDLYVEVEVEPAARLTVRATGEGADLAADASHLAATVAIDVAGHDRLAITVRSDIPVARGLGSSAALASCWSGAGPTLLGICDGADGESVRTKAEGAMAEMGVPGRAMLLRPDLEGLVVDGGATGPYDIGGFSRR
jgi:homoserine kinase